jgi:CheY-like chemotaxis protein
MTADEIDDEQNGERHPEQPEERVADFTLLVDDIFNGFHAHWIAGYAQFGCMAWHTSPEGCGRETLVNTMLSKPRILLIDDDPAILDLGQFILSRSGFAVDTATDGATGWDALRHHHYDAVVTDNLMPNVTGLALMKLMKDARMKTPVIMITGTVPAAEYLRANNLHPAMILQKPFAVGELLDAVRSCVSVAKAA